MIVTFGTRAEIRAPFTAVVQTLETAIDAIEPSDEATVLAEALALARAFTTNDRPDEVKSGLREAPPTLELYSDGRIEDLDTLALREGEGVLYHRVGLAERNFAVASVSAERPPDSPDRIQVFAALVNPRSEPAQVTLQLADDGIVIADIIEIGCPRRAFPQYAQQIPGFPGADLHRRGAEQHEAARLAAVAQVTHQA